MVTHRQVEIFRAVMMTGSVTDAAKLLYTSQPTVSRELARLEQRVGFTLFDRIKSRLQPTARAHRLFEEVQRSYVGLERVAEAAANLARPDGGQLSISCLPAFAHALMPAVCHRLYRRHGAVRITITPQESPVLEEWLTAQRFDLGITERTEAPAGTRCHHLLDADEVCVLPAGHPLLAKAVLTPEDLAGQPFVSLSPQDPYRLLVDQMFADAGVARQLIWETHSAVSVCALVAEGLGVAIVNPLTALALAGDKLHWRRLSVSIPFRVSAIVPQFRPSSPLVTDCLELLTMECDALTQRLAAS